MKNRSFRTAARAIARFLPTLLTLLSLACPAFCGVGVCAAESCQVAEETAVCGCHAADEPAPSQPCPGECEGCFCDGALPPGDAPSVIGGGVLLPAVAAGCESDRADGRVLAAVIRSSRPPSLGRTPLSVHAGLLL